MVVNISPFGQAKECMDHRSNPTRGENVNLYHANNVYPVKYNSHNWELYIIFFPIYKLFDLMGRQTSICIESIQKISFFPPSKLLIAILHAPDYIKPDSELPAVSLYDDGI